jgi:CubicO group peptidase (beta-lactamase class C family)
VAPALRATLVSVTLTEELRDAVHGRAPGIAIAIVDPGGVRAAAATGFANLATGVAATAQMVCPWFSMTKIVTATVAMRLAESKVLDLDAPAISLVPAFATLEPAERAARITPRHLLSHSAGLANPVPVRWIHPAGDPGPDQDEFLAKLLAKHRKLRFEPGTRSSYSNLGTLALGSALARATGRTFVDLAREEVLQPLQMSSTGFAYSRDMAARAATGYHPRWSPMRLLVPRWAIGPPMGRWISFHRFLLDGSAYGGLVGPVEDAARFLQMHLCAGELDGRRVLSADTTEAMQQIDMKGRRFDLGLGWFRPADQRSAEPGFVEHLGGGAGFFNMIRIYPSRRVGIAIMGNATKYDIDAVAALALRA